MSLLHCSKLHATGNDFLVLDALTGGPDLDAVSVAALCDRHRGIGADGVITIGPGHDGADCTMTLVNADGGVAEMSGNGIRCLAYVAAQRGVGSLDRLIVDTAGGRRVVALQRDADGAVTGAEVDMGPATFDPAQIPLDAPSPFGLEATVHGVTYRGDAAGMGNPHFVLFVDDVARARVTQHGGRLEHDARFPRRTNVEFCAVTGTDAITLRVWERGVGETLSCGTGACAAAAVAHHHGFVGADVTVHVPGGVLTVRLGDTIHLGGPVVHVFDVAIDRDRLLRSLA